MKYKLTIFKNRFQSEGRLSMQTFEEIFFAFRNKVKRTRETFSEYMGADKQTQSTIKDVGGFIGGETAGNKRINGIKITRQLLTLDIDVKLPNVLEYLKRNTDFLSIVYSTHSHSPSENRLRLVAPLSREVNADEYEALGRRIAFQIENSKTETLQGLFDETTFQANRLMFFPSVSADGEYICELLNHNMFADEQKIIDVDVVLSEYIDYKDIFEWFKPEKIDFDGIGRNTPSTKQPLKAKGMVGAFNRTYSISEAIKTFLSHIYKKEKNGRYSYLPGDSHGGGIILNDDTIFYSHHGTDPANLYYRSAFDLVRIHLFGSFDNSFTPERMLSEQVLEKTDSFLKMVEFARAIPEVVEKSDSNIALMQRLEKQTEYIEKFYDEKTTPENAVILEKSETHNNTPENTENGNTGENQAENTKQWIVQLDGLKSNLAKLEIIFSNDELIGNMFYFDTFRDNICFYRKPYWHRNFVEGVALQDKDMAHIRTHLDKVYGIRGERMIEDAIVVEADKIQKNKVYDYFESLVWDGKERIETFFYDFFKVPLNPFTRVAFKHWLVGAVSRIYNAGSPMDLLLIIKGAQGIGKSLFFKRLATFDFRNQGEHLYSDTKIDFNKAKDSYEQLEGIWIYEWKELAGMNMSEQESIKAFVDKTEDKFRRSYGRRNVEIKRRVAFGGTTNEKTPLRDRTGNRRFLVMESKLKQHECYIKDTNLFSQEYKDQLIAEAIHIYKSGYDIFKWSVEELQWWEKTNDENLSSNDLVGSIEAYINMKRPTYWYSLSQNEMVEYIEKYDFEIGNTMMEHYALRSDELEYGKKFCIQEIWKIALRQRDITINSFHRGLIISALEQLGWKLEKRQTRFGVFGSQQTITKNDDINPFENI